MLLSVVACLVATATTSAPWTGQWDGYHTTYGRQHPISLTISPDNKISGSYDDRGPGNDWAIGTVKGNVSKDGKFKLLFNFGKNAAWGQIEGKFVAKDDGHSLIDEKAIYTFPSHNPDRRYPQTVTVSLKAKS